MMDNAASLFPSAFPTRAEKRAGYDEANVSRLGLISIQERILEDYTRWSVEFFRDGRSARLQCMASAEYGGVPHGLDGDVVTALTDLYIEQGAPEDGKVRISAYGLLKRAGFTDAEHYYAALKRSLHLLRFAGYSASECWRDAERERWITVTFTYLAGLKFSAEDEDLHLGRASELEVTLAEPVVRSIRASYLKPLDYTFLHSLTRPLTRSLFRLLDAQRYDPLNLTQALPSIRMGLIQWASDCKLSSLTPDKIRRSLERAHQELIERGYLSEVIYEGKGSQQVVIYRFHTQPGMGPQETQFNIDHPLLQHMVERRISAPVAIRMLSQFGEEHVARRLQLGEQILVNGFAAKNPSAFLVDVIKDAAEKYESGELSGLMAKAVPVAREKLAQVSAAPSSSDDEEVSKTPAEQAAATLSVLKLVFHTSFSADEYEQLERYLLSPGVDAAALGHEGLAAKLRQGTVRFGNYSVR